MFFTKKKEAAGPVPPERIDGMISKGMSDRDIIKTLKSEGYSYEQIEGAMMNAVKSGVDEPPPMTAVVQRSALPDMEMPDPGSAETIEPEQIVEELIESVVENKWKKFDAEIERLNTEINSLREAQKSRLPPKAGDDERVSALSLQIDDLTARVGGLEKAFRQFLPSLTKNIESLSNIIHEMKAKQRIPQ